jgi:hypothetical protein
VYFNILLANFSRFVGIPFLIVQIMPTFLRNLLTYENSYLKSGFNYVICCAVS